jgi:hypothetical protein
MEVGRRFLDLQSRLGRNNAPSSGKGYFGSPGGYFAKFLKKKIMCLSLGLSYDDKKKPLRSTFYRRKHGHF